MKEEKEETRLKSFDLLNLTDFFFFLVDRSFGILLLWHIQTENNFTKLLDPYNRNISKYMIHSVY